MTSIHQPEANTGPHSGNLVPIIQQFNEVTDDRPKSSNEPLLPKIQIDLDDIKEEV